MTQHKKEVIKINDILPLKAIYKIIMSWVFILMQCIWKPTYENYCFHFSTIQLWNLESNINAHAFELHNDCVNTMAFSSDGKYLASGTSDE